MSKIYKRCNHNSISSYTKTILSIFISAYKKSYSSNRVLLRLIEHWEKNLETIKICSYCSYGSLQGFWLIPNDLLAANLHAFVWSEEAVNFVYPYLKRRKGCKT